MGEWMTHISAIEAKEEASEHIFCAYLHGGFVGPDLADERWPRGPELE